MYIGICDDEEKVRLLLRQYIASADRADEIFEFENPDDVKRHLKKEKPLDILFLDIDLGDAEDGLSLAGELKRAAIEEGRGNMTLPLIIFVTGYPDRMSEAFNVSAFHFLLKPIEKKVFEKVLMKAKKAVEVILFESDDRVISCSSGGITFAVKTSDIFYVESFGRKLIFHTASGEREIYGKISDIAKELGNSFYPIHRSYVVNMAKILDYSRQEITLIDDEKIPMSKYKRADFIKVYAAFLGGASLG